MGRERDISNKNKLNQKKKETKLPKRLKFG
jgi:hypothetical protein